VRSVNGAAATWICSKVVLPCLCVLVKACCSGGCDYFRWLSARFRCGGGGSVDGEVHEWWSATTMVMVGEEEN